MRYLFVGGPARSGTSAFTRLINTHPSIVLGMERYKFFYPKRSVSPDLFEDPRFFNPQPDETNVSMARMGDVDVLRRNFESAEYRGDKVPHILRYYKHFNEYLPGCKFIIMYRNIHRICSSWNVRAERKGDSWSPTNDFRVAVDAVNKELRSAVNLHKEQPSRFLIARYENVFSSTSLDTMGKILDWLEVKPHPQLAMAIEKNMKIAERIKNKPLLEYDGQREYIQQNIDWPVIERVESIAV